jgi:hypothetical protein
MEDRVKTSTPDGQTDVDWAALEALCDSTELWTMADIVEFFGVARTSVWHWVRACGNYQWRGATEWPPTQSELRHRYEMPSPPPAERRWWPDYTTILPPVDVPGGDGRDRWYKGSVMRWGLRTKRVDLTGSPASLKAGARSRGRTWERAAADQAAVAAE